MDKVQTQAAGSIASIVQAVLYATMGLFAKSNAAYCEAATAMGVDLSKLTWGNYFGGNMLPVTLGNIIGGLLVGFIFWFCWIRKPKEAK